MKKIICKVLLLTITLIFSAGCTFSNNNDRSFWDLIKHFETNGVHVKSVNPLATIPVQAAAAFAFTIGTHQVGVYKYDSNNEKHREKLKKVDETGVFYAVGIRYKAVRNGSYVLIDTKNHPQGEEIIRVFKSF